MGFTEAVVPTSTPEVDVPMRLLRAETVREAVELA